MMTQEEKRKLALQIMQQEQARHASSTVFDTTRLNAAARNAIKLANVKKSLGQNGISWEQLQEEYKKSYEKGKRDALTYIFSFFYAATAIAFHESFNATPEETNTFFQHIPIVLGESEDNHQIMQMCQEQTGINTSLYSTTVSVSGPTQKDIAAINRMKKTGITTKDLEYERKTGYDNGRASQTNIGVCFAAVSLVLSRYYHQNAEQIQSILSRIEEISDEEINTTDIIQRAQDEAGVDVTGMVYEEIKLAGP